MTLHSAKREVGVRELHDRLSEYLAQVSDGSEIIVTRRGKQVARLSGITEDDPLSDLVRRGLVQLPNKPRTTRQARVKPRGSVSDLVAEQRR